MGLATPVPIVLESSQFQGTCDVADITPSDTCNFWYNNGNAAIGDANWGFLSLDEWGVHDDHKLQLRGWCRQP